jgi:hypothetical protein
MRTNFLMDQPVRSSVNRVTAKAAQAIITALGTVDAPLRLMLGNDVVDAIRGRLERGLADIAFWEPVARKAGFDP